MKYIYSVKGFVSALLGIKGIFRPVSSLTPFLLLAAALFLHSSSRAYKWLTGYPRLKSFHEDKSIPLRIKIISVGTLWITAAHCIFFAFDILWLKLFMGILATCMILYIHSFKTRKNKCQD